MKPSGSTSHACSSSSNGGRHQQQQPLAAVAVGGLHLLLVVVVVVAVVVVEHSLHQMCVRALHSRRTQWPLLAGATRWDLQ